MPKHEALATTCRHCHKQMTQELVTILHRNGEKRLETMNVSNKINSSTGVEYVYSTMKHFVILM